MEKRNFFKWIPVLLLAAMLLGLFGCAVNPGGDPTTDPTNGSVAQPTGTTTEATEPAVEETLVLCWNVDGQKYRSGAEKRIISADGYYYFNMAIDGAQKRVAVQPDYTLVQKIDALELLYLVMDKDGIVVDACRADINGASFAARRYYITGVEGKTVHFNTAVDLDGVQTSFTYDDDTKIYLAGDSTPTAGMPTGAMRVDDQIIALRDKDGRISHIYVLPYILPPDIYWNINRMYDSTAGSTTRRANASGEYVFDLAVNGEQVQVKTKDPEMAQAMDAMAAKCFALTFDADGYVNSVTNAGEATGSSKASWYHVTGIDGRDLSFTRIVSPNAGATGSGKASKDCKVYDVSGMGAYVGEPTQLRYGDQVHCLADTRGKICIIFVVNRLAEADIHWNVERKYDSANKVSTRQPDGNGWYKFLLATKGKQVTVRTKDVDIVNLMDGRAARCFGVTYDENGIITNYYTPDAVSGGGTWASWYVVTDLDGDKITVKKSSTGDVKTGTIAADCEIYNVSDTAAMSGEITTVREGDEIHTLMNLDGEVSVIFVVTRTENMPVYWNVSPKYDKSTASTTRTREEDGYYHFEMCYGGETVTMRVKDKSVADFIDSQAAKCVAVKVDGDVIYKAYHPKNSLTTKNGAYGGSWVTVTKVTSTGYSAQKVESGVVTNTFKNMKFAANCKIYNVSDNVKSHRGEVSTISVGDTIHTLANGNNEITYVFILSHTLNLDLDVYYNKTQKWDKNTSSTTRTPNADGEYEFQMAHNGQSVTVKTKDKAVADAIDKEVAKCLTIEFDQDGYAIWAGHARNAATANGGPVASYTYVTEVSADGKTAKAEKVEGGVVTAVYELQFNDKTKVYNVSTRIENNWGEETTLQVGDYVHGLKTADGYSSYLYVMTRPLPTTQHTCSHITEDVVWHEWDGSPITESGYYVVQKDLQLSQRIDISAGQKVVLCLNGKTVENSDRFFRVYGELTICDHKNPDGTYSGKMISGASGSTYGVIAYLYNEKGGNPVLTIQGGNFLMTGTAKDGGLVYVGNKNTANGGGTGVFKLEGGVLTGSTTSTGGAVSVTNDCTFEMSGGMITGSSAASGAVAVGVGCSFTMTGGEISGNTSTGNGGAVHVVGGAFLMTGGTISGNTASGNGGGVNVDSGSFAMTGGTISGNTAAEGGNMRIGKNGQVALSGNALLTGGTAKNGGSITMFGKLTVSENAKIEAGTVTGEGSAISVFCNFADGNVEVNVLGGTIEGTIRYDGAKGKAVMNLLGGTVDTVNFKNVAVNDLFVGGSVTVREIRVADGKTIGIHENGLKDTASIGITMADPTDPITTITDPADEACFYPVDAELYLLENRENVLYLKSKIQPHDHCICGGKAVGVGDHSCGGVTGFLPWTSNNSLPVQGNFYLTEDVTLSGTITVAKNTTLNLCLCGKTITSTVRVFKVNGTLNITDCQDTAGTITSSSTGLAPVLYAYENAAVNLYNGNLVATSQVQQAGVLAMGGNTSAVNRSTASVLRIYGGTISGGNVTKSGGNISIFDGAWLYLYGGTVTGGTAAEKGGNIYVANGSAHLLGGTVTGGTASLGGGFFTASGHGVTVGGDVNITGNNGSDLYLPSGKTLTLADSGLEDTASIGITMEVPGAFLTTDDAKDADCFTPDDELTYQISYTGGALVLEEIPEPSEPTDPSEPSEPSEPTDPSEPSEPSEPTDPSEPSEPSEPTDPSEPVVIPHTHCVCGGKAVGVGDHTSCSDITYLPWDAEASANYMTTLPSEGNYYLTEDVNLTARFDLAAGKTLNLCLCGKTVNGPGGAVARVMNVSGFLNITDCDEDGDGQYGAIQSTYTGSYGGIFYTYNGTGPSAINLYNGSLIYTGTGVSNSGGIGRVANTAANAAGTNTSAFNMYGGTVSGGKAPSGGGLYLDHSGVFNMYGGKITNCTATGATGTGTNNGGALYMNNYSTFNMYGGKITGCSTTGSGNCNGGVAYVNVYGVVNMYGGELSGNTAVNHGSAFFLTGTASRGHNTYLYLSGGKITGNTGNSAIYVGGRGNLVVSGTAFVDENRKTDGTHCNVNLSSGKTITVAAAGMETGARVYVTASNATTNAFATVTNAADAAFFFSDKAQYDVTCDSSNRLFMVETTRHKHCDCCGLAGEDHICFRDAQWTEVTDLSAFQSQTVSGVASYVFPASGNYCLGGDLVLDKPIAVTSGQNITLCLNGKTLSFADRVFYVRGGTLNITDCQKDDAGYKGYIRGNTGDKATYGGVFYLYAGSTMNLCGGNLVGNPNATKASSGGVGAVAGSADTVMNMYDGTISGGKTTGNGGNIIIWDGARMNMYGGTISGGQSNGGGNIGVTKGTFNLENGTVSGGVSTGFAGNIRVGQEAAMLMSGGTVTGGIAKNGGGNIYGNKNGSKLALITITGGTITQGSLNGDPADSGYHGGAGLLNYGTTQLSGNPVISGNSGDNYLVSPNSLNIIEDGLTEGAQIWMTLKDADKTKSLGTAFSEADGAYLFSDDAAYTVSVAADKKVGLTPVTNP